MSDPTPEVSGLPDLPIAFRGYSPKAVIALLERLNGQLSSLTEERDRLAGRLGEFASRDLQTEFQQLGSEVSEVLESARRAADSMRERASTDASRWRSEALAEVEAERRAARADAEQLRGDAWTTAENLLAECQREADRLGAAAEKDALRKVGEAEREAHRIQSTARRESEDQIRTGRMEAERLVVAAQTQHDDIIEAARRQAEASQERTRALEQRRDELKREIDSVRAALSGVEGEMDEKREQLGLSQPTTAEATPTTPLPRWSPGETVRVLRKSGEPRDDSEAKVIPAPPPKVEPPDPKKSPAEFADALVSALKPKAHPAVVVEAEPEPDPVVLPEADEAVEAEPAMTDVSGLFDRLRSPAPTPVPEPVVIVVTEPEPVMEAAVEAVPAKSPSSAPFELRDRMLLPVTNRALRGLKRQLTEEQNVALEQLRVDENAWEPDPGAIRNRVKADLASLLEESFSAGHEAAQEVSGRSIDSPKAAKSDAGAGFVDDLVSELAHTVKDGRAAGHGSRQLGADVSRVFRAWRTDEAERRVRDLSAASYHAGLTASLRAAGFDSFNWVVAGRGCASCRAAAERSDVDPPLHPGCSCTVVPV
ncbi:MAG: DivIVA domain-containing protein [Acidimicrobiia bacterium]|nr:DivIVA domain-containing protein [Acidimicrobiia bacterium]